MGHVPTRERLAASIWQGAQQQREGVRRESLVAVAPQDESRRRNARQVIRTLDRLRGERRRQRM